MEGARATGRRWRRLGRPLGAALALAALGGGGWRALRPAPPPTTASAPCLDGVLLAGAPARAGEAPAAFVARREAEILAARVVARDGDEVVVAATLGALGGALAARDAVEQALERRTTCAGAVELPLRVELPVEALAEQLAAHKDEGDERPRAARLSLGPDGSRTVRPDAPGRSLDVHALAAAVERAANERLRRGEAPAELAVTLPWVELRASATAERVAGVDASAVLARYETVFGAAGGQAGRGQNIARAAAGIDGVVLFPGEVVSFNENVGPRSLENGFAVAAEIYKGEMRQGIGGGTCQVAGTLHAAAVYGGLDVVQRANHSRPSGYIGLGLDATVVYPEVDLRLRNPFDFPVVIRARPELIGGFGKLVVELLGASKVADVKLVTETLGRAAFKRKIQEIHGLPEGEFRLKQRGIRGVTVKKTRSVRLAGGAERVEVTVDVYPPTQEIYLVPKGMDPSLLPPPPEPDAAG